MGIRFHRSLKIFPGVRLNFSKSGVSTSVGVRGAHVTFGHGHVRETVGVPGTGISYTTISKSGSTGSQQRQSQPSSVGAVGWMAIIFFSVCCICWLFGNPTASTPTSVSRSAATAPPAKPAVSESMPSSNPSQSELHGLATVGVDTLNVRDRPNGNVVAVLHKEDRVDVYEQRDGWDRISAPGTPAKWVFGKLLK